VPFDAWADASLQATRALPDRVSAFVLETFFVPTEHGRLIRGLFVDAALSTSNTEAALARARLSCPPVTAALWQRYLGTPAETSPPSA
jgi:hypothetical protein